MVGLGIALILIPAFNLSADRERRPMPPTRHIWSQRWAKHAEVLFLFFWLDFLKTFLFIIYIFRDRGFIFEFIYPGSFY